MEHSCTLAHKRNSAKAGRRQLQPLVRQRLAERNEATAREQEKQQPEYQQDHQRVCRTEYEHAYKERGLQVGPRIAHNAPRPETATDSKGVEEENAWEVRSEDCRDGAIEQGNS